MTDNCGTEAPGREIRFRSLIEALQHVVFTLDENGLITYISPGCTVTIGYLPEEMIGKSITSFFSPTDIPLIHAKFSDVLKGKIYPSDYHAVDRSGKIHYVRAVSRLYTDPDGKTGIAGIIGDISNWVLAEEALRDQEEITRRIVGHSNDGIVLFDESGILREWNPAMEQITGISRSVVLGKSVTNDDISLVLDGSSIRDLSSHLQKLIPGQVTGKDSGKNPVMECTAQRTDGSSIAMECSVFRIPVGSGFMNGGIIRDVTERRKNEQALVTANKKLHILSSITRHDINNQLSVITGYLSLIRSNESTRPSEKYFSFMQQASDRIQRILAFTREYQEIGIQSKVWQNLGNTICSASDALGTDPVHIVPDPSCSTIEVLADPMFGRVFYNLIDNSLKHGGNVSEILIQCSMQHHDLVIIYEDNGIGIPDTVRSTLFEPGKGKIHGYGLFLIREILAITGFGISETGKAGSGARFEILVPDGSFRKTGNANYPVKSVSLGRG